MRPNWRLKSTLCVNTLAAKTKESRHSEVHNIVPVCNYIDRLTFYRLVLNSVGWVCGQLQSNETDEADTGNYIKGHEKDTKMGTQIDLKSGWRRGGVLGAFREAKMPPH